MSCLLTRTHLRVPVPPASPHPPSGPHSRGAARAAVPLEELPSSVKTLPHQRVGGRCRWRGEPRVAGPAEVDLAFDTLKASRDLQAEAFSDTVATKADIANLKAEMFRALWIQGAGLVVVQLAIAGLLYTLLTSSPP